MFTKHVARFGVHNGNKVLTFSVLSYALIKRNTFFIYWIFFKVLLVYKRDFS